MQGEENKEKLAKEVLELQWLLALCIPRPCYTCICQKNSGLLPLGNTEEWGSIKPLQMA